MISVMVLAGVAAATPAPVAGAAAHVISYPADFFGASQPTSALDMLGHLPGFTFDRGGGTRGFTGAAGNVLVDGARPASKDDNLEDVLRRIPASSVLRVEVILGGAPGIDMQGKTVLANIIRRRDAGGKVTVSLSGTRGLDGILSGNLLLQAEQRFGDTAVEGSFRAAKFLDSGLGAGSWVRAGPDGAPIFVANEASRGADQQYKATGAVETPLLGGKLRLNLSLNHEPYTSVQSDALTPAPGLETDQNTQVQNTGELGLRYERAFGPKLKLEAIALQRLGRQVNTDTFLSDAVTSARTGDGVSALFNLRKSTSESIGRINLTVQASPTLALQLGGEGDYNRLSSATRFRENGALVALPSADVQVNELRGEGFATATWQATTKLTAEAGVRVEASRIASSGDVISSRTLVFPKPRVALTYSPEGADQFRLRVEREVGQLNFDDFTAQTAGLNTGTVQAGNPTLNPDSDWVAEAAWERKFWRAADITVTYRHFWLDTVVDRIGVPSPSGTYDAPGDIGSGGKDELAIALTLPTDRLGIPRGQITGDATLRHSSVTDPTTGQTRSASGLHQSDWNLHFTQGLPRWKASWGADISGPFIETFYRFNEVDTNKLSLFVQLFAEYQPRPDLSFRVEFSNAAGQGLERSRQLFTDARGSSALVFTDVHSTRLRQFLKLKIVKSFS